MNIIRAIAVLICLWPMVTVFAGSFDVASVDDVPSLENDFQQLQGKWVKRVRAEEWILNFQSNPRGFQLAISVSEPAFTASKSGLFSGLQEDARGRYFELGPGGPLLSQRIYYRFDRDNLVLEIPDGPVRGLHTLERERAGAPYHKSLVIGAVIVLSVVLIGAVILFRLRANKAAEPTNAGEQA